MVRSATGTCWSKRTPFQLGLILILIVTGTFLLVMITLYILLGFAWHKSEECNKLCRVLDKSRETGTNIEKFKVPEPRQTEEWWPRPWLVNMTRNNETGNVTNTPTNSLGDQEEDSSEANQQILGRRAAPAYVNPSTAGANTEVASANAKVTEEVTAASANKKVTSVNASARVVSTNGRGTAGPVKVEEVAGNQADNAGMDSGNFQEKPKGRRIKKSAENPNGFFALMNDPPPFPAIAALLEQLYRDDFMEEVFLCSVAIISPNWALTTHECLRSDCLTRLHLLSIRLNSKYWSYGGTIKLVRKIFCKDKLAAILMRPHFNEPTFTSLEISRGLLEPNRGLAFMWISGLAQPLHHRLKYSPLQHMEVSYHESKTRLHGFGDVFVSYSGETGAPLLDDFFALVGFQIGCYEDVFVYRKVDQHIDWLREIGAIP